MSSELFVQTIERAAKYRIEEIKTLERIAVLYLHEGTAILPLATVDEHFTQREAYLEGSLTDAPDLLAHQNTEDPPDHEEHE